MKRSMKGVSLIELMVAITVVGIVAAVAIPAYQDHVRYGDTSKCATYILSARLNATDLIMINNGDITGIDAVALGLDNANDECSGGITVTGVAGVLSVIGDTGAPASSPSTRTFTMRRAAANGAWSCETTDSSSNVLYTGSCTKFNN